MFDTRFMIPVIIVGKGKANGWLAGMHSGMIGAGERGGFIERALDKHYGRRTGL